MVLVGKGGIDGNRGKGGIDGSGGPTAWFWWAHCPGCLWLPFVTALWMTYVVMHDCPSQRLEGLSASLFTGLCCAALLSAASRAFQPSPITSFYCA
eukprot:1158677-Pelagomonas_calceolata.AAC.5